MNWDSYNIYRSRGLRNSNALKFHFVLTIIMSTIAILYAIVNTVAAFLWIKFLYIQREMITLAVGRWDEASIVLLILNVSFFS